MKSSRKFAVAMMLSATLFGLASAPACAQTTAPGPYYATPSWDQTLPSNTRFIVLSNFNSEAVLDRDTGLVWQRNITSSADWGNAAISCFNKVTGGRFGWRLPSVDELSSLLDPTHSNPALPSGNPFQFQTNTTVWAANSSQALTDFAWVVNFGFASVSLTEKNTLPLPSTWCVRGGSIGSTPQ